MNYRLLTSLSLAMLIAYPAMSFAHEGKHAPATDSATVTEQAKPAVAAVELFSAALRAGDLEGAGALLAEDVLILESGGAEHSRDEYLGGHASDDAAFLKTAHVQIKQRAARVAGNLAWVGTESELSTSRNGQPITLLSTETMVLARRGEGWQIVHIHWSSRRKR